MSIKLVYLIISIASVVTAGAGSVFTKDEDCDDIVLYSTFDVKLNKCIIPLGSKCRDIPSNDNFVCPPDSECSSRGICSCKERFMPINTEKFSCILGNTLGEACDDQRYICDTEYAKLTCESSRCQCDRYSIWNAASKLCIKKECDERNSYAYLDPARKKCIMKIGETLGKYPTMPEPASYLEDQLLFCPSNTTLVRGLSTIRKSLGQVYTCDCTKGFIPNSDGKLCLVQKWYKDACGEGDRCDPTTGLVCLNKRCRCAENAVWNPDNSLCYSDAACKERDWRTFYDAERKKCVIQIKRACEKTDEPNGLVCPLNASCTNLVPGRWFNSPHDFVHKEPACVCNSGYTETTDKRACMPIATSCCSCPTK